jgi:hypothetical protein
VTTSGLCDTAKPAACGDRAAHSRWALHSAAELFGRVVRESCYRFYKPPTRSFPWLQPKSPVVEVVVENGRGPDPPDARAGAARAALGSARPDRAPEAHASHRAEGNHRAADGSQAAKVAGANLRRANRAGVRQRAKEPEERAEEGRAPDESAQAAVAVLVVERSLPWLA